jgi:hypothetical protein
MGSVLIERLRKADITFEIVKPGAGKQGEQSKPSSEGSKSSVAVQAGGTTSLPRRLYSATPVATCLHMHAAADPHLHPGLRMLRRHMHARLSAARDGGGSCGPQQWLRRFRCHVEGAVLLAAAQAARLHTHAASQISACIDRGASDLLTQR